MRRILITAGLAASLASLPGMAAPCGGQHDILERSDPLLAPVRPPDCASTRQSPPEFTWPPQDGENRYTVVLTFPDGHAERRGTPHNWLLWDRELPPGKYRWQVIVDGAAHEQGAARQFTIEPGATAFVVPPPETILERARSAPRPRVWGAQPDGLAMTIRKDRAAGLASLRREVEDKIPAPVQPEPTSTSEGSNYEDTAAEFKRTVATALAWAATHEPRYKKDIERRLLAQASWNAAGPTSYKANDMANRTIAWGLALGYDLAADALDADERRTVLRAIAARTQPMFEDVTTRLAGYPYDSHGNVTLTMVAAIGVLMAGEIPQADRWVREAVPLAVAWTSPWGWKDGGFANGTAQMFWDTLSLLPAWSVLRNAGGVDLSRKEWVRNHLAFMAYFAPPGSPAGAFGDGREEPPGEFAWRAAVALDRFAPSPLGHWYASAQEAHDEGRLELLLASRGRGGPTAFPDGTPDDAFFPSVGWVAMHSRLADPNRTSVYFKSSPYGSYNHSHGDQNAFVIHHHGRRLAIASGTYDGYRTPHWNEWTKQTRSANAITFDGGQGQGFNGREFSGEVTGYGATRGLAWATGHAERAYGGTLKQAVRTIAYVKPSTIVVMDRLASETPRTWEWNLHALEKMQPRGPNAIELRSGPDKACVRLLAGPDMRFTQSNRFTAPPQGSKPPDEWHGTFSALQPSTEARIVTVIQLDASCQEAPEVEAKREGDGWVVSAGGRQLRIEGDTVSAPNGAQSPRAR